MLNAPRPFCLHHGCALLFLPLLRAQPLGDYLIDRGHRSILFGLCVCVGLVLVQVSFFFVRPLLGKRWYR